MLRARTPYGVLKHEHLSLNLRNFNTEVHDDQLTVGLFIRERFTPEPHFAIDKATVEAEWLTYAKRHSRCDGQYMQGLKAMLKEGLRSGDLGMEVADAEGRRFGLHAQF